MTAELQAMMPDMNSDETERRTATEGSLPDPFSQEDADEDEWDPLDLENRAEEFAFQDAYDRGLFFA